MKETGQMPALVDPGRQLVDEVERLRLQANELVHPVVRAELGQFLTPSPVSLFMASMFRTRRQRIHLLDPGAGVGSLTAAFVATMIGRRPAPASISVTAYELDRMLAGFLRRTLELCKGACRERQIEFEAQVRQEDYIGVRTGNGAPLLAIGSERPNCVIMNPPHRKIHTRSVTRLQLRSVDIETSNLYTAFMLLAARQLAEGGEFVSINPRSFCNGPYFRAFRKEFLRLIDLKRIHIYESRSQTFRDDGVLQEHVIVHGRRSDQQGVRVRISTTTTEGQRTGRMVACDRVVRPGDRDAVIHITADRRSDEITKRMLRLQSSLHDLHVQVSTGKVVDFRVREHLRAGQQEGAVPLIYPAHFHDGAVSWPNRDGRKPNAIVATGETEDLLVQPGFYVLVRRFSAKEERRRVVAALFDPEQIPGRRIGFENHLNYFHSGGKGLAQHVAKGLAVFLNSTVLDDYFRQFSGHTQVNAADLRGLPYPTLRQLEQLARWCGDLGNQAQIDAATEAVFQSSR